MRIGRPAHPIFSALVAAAALTACGPRGRNLPEGGPRGSDCVVHVLSAPPGPDYVNVGQFDFEAELVGGRPQHVYKSPYQLEADIHADICAVGGDTLVTERNTAGEITHGTIYRHSTLPQLPERPVKPAAEACYPSCGTGFSCEAGSCVSMCNPACGDGQTCGNDALCHPVEDTAAPAPSPSPQLPPHSG